MNDEKTRRRWINFGEIIALAALIVSAMGVWIAWKSSGENKTTRVLEQRSAVPLALRGTADSDGRTLTISPAEPSHAIESIKITIRGSAPIEVGSDGKLSASDVERVLKDREKEAKDVALRMPIRIEANYVEMGKEHRGGGSYTLHYRWEGGGLFGSRTLHLVSLSR